MPTYEPIERTASRRPARLLNGVLELGDMRNVEHACDGIIVQYLRSRRSMLTPSEREDLLAFLVSESWMLHRRYDATRGAKFSTFAYPQLRLRVVDWYRRKLGRGAGPGEWGVEAIEGLDEFELERSLGARDGDDPFDRVSARIGLLAAGGGKPSRLVDARRGAAPRRAA